jgi:hypothetical protein
MARIFGRKIFHPLSSINPDAPTQGVNRTENVGEIKQFFSKANR